MLACNLRYTLVTRTTPRKQQFAAGTQKISGFRGVVRLRECEAVQSLQNYASIHRNAPAGTPGQGAIEPWRASSDGFVKHKKSASIIRTVSYRRSVSSVRVYARRNPMTKFSYYIKTIHKFFYKGKCPFLCTKPQKLCIIKANKRKLWEVALHEKLFKGS